MSGFAGLWIGIGLFCLGWGIECGMNHLASAIRYYVDRKSKP